MKPYQRNFMVGVASESLWGMGMGLFMPPTLLSLALVDLGGSSKLAGLLAALFGFGITLPQAFSALALPPRFTDPPRLVAIHLPALLGPLSAGLAFILVPPDHPDARLYTLLAGFALFSLGIGVVVPHWVGCVGRCLPEKIRGRYFGACFFASGLCATGTGWLGARWAAQGGIQWGYALCFLLAVPFFMTSLSTMLLFKPLAVRPMPTPPGALWKSFHLMNHKLIEPGPFRVGLVLVVLLTLVSAPGNLFTVYLREKGVEKSLFELFAPAMTLGGMLGSFCLGWIADHRGFRAAYVMAFSAGLLAMALVFFWDQPGLPATAFGCFGFLTTAFPVVNLVMILKLAGHRESTVQQGLFNTLMSPWSLLAPLFAGWLAGKVGYPWVFGSAIACVLVAFGILVKFQDLDGKPERRGKAKKL